MTRADRLRRHLTVGDLRQIAHQLHRANDLLDGPAFDVWVLATAQERVEERFRTRTHLDILYPWQGYFVLEEGVELAQQQTEAWSRRYRPCRPVTEDSHA